MFDVYMKAAIEEAKKAYAVDEVPIGAVIVKDNEIIAWGHNIRESTHDPTAHAEIVAIRRAGEYLGHWRLSGCQIFVTVEPCPMCAGAILQARIARLVFGVYDEKAGCCGTLYNLPEDPLFNHHVETFGGIMEEECRELLQDFFQIKRRRQG